MKYRVKSRKDVSNFASAIEDLERTAPDGPIDPEQLSEMLRGRMVNGAKVKSSFLLAGTAKDIVGHLLFTPEPRWTTIDRVVVRPGHDFKEVSTVLLNGLRRANHAWLRCWVPVIGSLVPLAKALEAYGFSAIPEDADTFRYGFREPLCGPVPTKEV